MPKSVLLALGLVLGSSQVFAMTVSDVVSKVAHADDAALASFTGSNADGKYCTVDITSVGDRVVIDVGIGLNSDTLVPLDAGQDVTPVSGDRATRRASLEVHSLIGASNSAKFDVQGGQLKSISLRTPSVFGHTNTACANLALVRVGHGPHIDVASPLPAWQSKSLK